MNTFWKVTGALLLGSSLALAGCDLGNENGNTDSGGATPPPVTPLAYSGSSTPATLTSSNQSQAGGSAASTVGGLISNAVGGGLGNIIGPISIAADQSKRASNATIVSLFASLNFDQQNRPAAVVSQPFTNPAPCTSGAYPDGQISYYLSGVYIVVKFESACLKVLNGGADEAVVDGQVVVTASNDGNHYTFTPSNLTIDDAGTVYKVPAGTYMLDNGALSILVPCHGDVCKITAPSDLSASSPYSFTDAKVSDPDLGVFNVAGSNLALCAQGDNGTPESPFQAGGTLTLTTDPASITVTVTTTGCGQPLSITP